MLVHSRCSITISCLSWIRIPDLAHDGFSTQKVLEFLTERTGTGLQPWPQMTERLLKGRRSIACSLLNVRVRGPALPCPLFRLTPPPTRVGVRESLGTSESTHPRSRKCSWEPAPHLFPAVPLPFGPSPPGSLLPEDSADCRGQTNRANREEW